LKIKTISISILSILGILVIKFIFFPSQSDEKEIIAEAKRGTFVISITGTGELRAKSETEINAPQELRSLGIYDIKISDLIDEGTHVETGDFIASLDPTDLQKRISEESINLQKKEQEFKQAQLDTTLTLREAREELVNLQYQLDEKKLIKEQSIYEAPAVIKQVQLDYERTQRQLEEKQKNYSTKVAQATTKVQIVGSELAKTRSKMNDIMNTMQKLTILAPKDGIVIYAKNWNGKKKVVGSSINMWDPEVAALPDLSVMETVTYINEVDVRNVKKGNKVQISLDSDPNKKLSGEVISVSNIGEQKPNSDAKVFEVIISIHEKDSTLRPSMTTSCKIECGVFHDAVSVPLEAVHNAAGKSYVFIKKGSGAELTEVKTGEMNDTDIIIKEGLSGGEKILLSIGKTNKEKLEALQKSTTSTPK
jgi:RND family efflux transporter MFP subunit